MPKTSASKPRNTQGKLPSKLLSKLLQRIASTTSSAVIEVPAKPFKPDVLMEMLTKAGFQVTLIDPADQPAIQNKDALLRALHANRSLPKHFGFNWDALVDSLSDLTPGDAKGFVLILQQPQTLRAQSPEDYATFVTVMGEVSARWAAEGVPFKLLLPKAAA
jgi:RNAse (barnase) inhibitor barstar